MQVQKLHYRKRVVGKDVLSFESFVREKIGIKDSYVMISIASSDGFTLEKLIQFHDKELSIGTLYIF